MTRPTAIVVGSGAAGCAAAKELSATHDVTILEAGAEFKRFSWKYGTIEPFKKAGLMADERMINALFPAMRVIKAKEGLVHVHGKALGGTTHLATGNRVRCDAYLKDIGINLDAEFAELDEIVPASTCHTKQWNGTTKRLFEIFQEQGLDPFVMPKFMEEDAPCISCGRCALGCPTGAKWTADKLLKGLANVTVRTGVSVERLIASDGKASGVIVRDGMRKRQLAADLIILAAGGMGTPVILRNSGLAVEPTLFDDPVLCLAAKIEGANMDKQIPMPFASQQDGYILSPYFDLLSFFFNKDWRHKSNDIVSIMIKYEDEGCGTYDGRTLSMPYTTADEQLIERALKQSMDILVALGVDPDKTFCGTLNAGHPGGALPLTPAEAETFHNPALPSNVYVADSTLFPHSMGNPPILTIMALAKRVAKTAGELT